MSDLRGMCSTEGTVIDTRRKTAPSLILILSQVLEYLTLTHKMFGIIRHLLASLVIFPRATAKILYLIFIFQVFLSGITGITSHVASQAHTVARNTRSIMLAVCALPIPFSSLLCVGIRNEAHSSVDPSIDHSPAWHPFLINEDLHGPAVDFAIRKAANTTTVVLAFVRASDLPQRREISDKLKDFLQVAWASEMSSGAHLSLVKIVIDEMMLGIDATFAKLHADLHPSFLSRLMTFNWAHRAEQAILEALDISADSTTAHARFLVAHGEPVYNCLRFLESIAGDISNLLASEGAAVERGKEEIEARVLSIFGGHRNAVRILKGRVAELQRISHFWMEARVSLSLGIHAFNGVRNDLIALSEHRSGLKTARMQISADKQALDLKGWVRRLDARRVLMPTEMYGHRRH